MKTLIYLMFLFLFNSCSLQGIPTSETTDLRVNHYQQTAIGLYPQLVLLVQENEEIGKDSWKYFYDEIDGFDYEPGFIYDLKVEKTYLENPPQDASAISYKLIEITQKEKVGEESKFEMMLKLGYDDGGADFFVTGDPDLGFKILEEIKIDCNSLCVQLEEALQKQNSITGVFRHLGEEEIYLLEIKEH